MTYITKLNCEFQEVCAKGKKYFFEPVNQIMHENFSYEYRCKYSKIDKDGRSECSLIRNLNEDKTGEEISKRFTWSELEINFF